MTTDGKDILLDAFLSETLRGESPPDLSGRILAALRERRRAVEASGKASSERPQVASVPSAVPSREKKPAVAPIRAEAARTPATRSHTPQAQTVRPTHASLVEPAGKARLLDRGQDREIRWQRLATAACVSAVALSAAVAYLLFDRAGIVGQRDATVAVEQDPVSNDRDKLATDDSRRDDGTNGATTGGSDALTPSPADRLRPRDPVLLPAPFEVGQPQLAERAADDASGALEPESPYDEGVFADASEAPGGSLALIPHVDDFRVLSKIDGAFETIWSEARVEPAPEVSQLLWVRRAYLHVLGRIPTVAELRDASDKLTTFERQRLIISLTEREEFFDRWAAILADEALGPTDFETGAVDRYQFERYLAGKLREGVPFHEIVAELISAEGSNDPQAKDFDPAVNFLLAGVRTVPSGEQPLPDQGVLAASRTSRAFLGERLQCVQCHDHPDNDWKQDRFWQFAAFFQQTHVERVGENRARIVDRNLTDDATLYSDAAGRAKSVHPEFRDFRIDPNGDVDVVRRRDALAELVAVSPDVYRSLVHRVWRRFFGFGLAPIVDDLGAHRAEYHPEAVDVLASETASHGGKLQDLVRWIALSEPFRRSAATPRGKSADRPEEGTTPYFSRYYVRPLAPGTVYDSLLVAADAYDARRAASREAFAKKRAWLAAFRTARDSDEDPHVVESFDPTPTMLLEMMNGDLTADALAVDSGSYLDRLARSSAPPSAKFEHLFLAAFARMPSPQERMLSAQLYHANPGKPEDGLQNLWWALLNSNEFILDH